MVRLHRYLPPVREFESRIDELSSTQTSLRVGVVTTPSIDEVFSQINFEKMEVSRHGISAHIFSTVVLVPPSIFRFSTHIWNGQMRDGIDKLVVELPIAGDISGLS